MQKIMSSACALALGAGLFVAAPADASSPAPAYAGYAATVSSHVRGARVTLRVPTLTCRMKSPTRSVRIGLFAHNDKGKATTLDLRASCTSGQVHYATAYNGRDAGLPVYRGDRVRLIIDGAVNYEVDDLTSGEDVATVSRSRWKPDSRLTHDVLIGAQVIGTPPSGFTTVFSYARVNGALLAKVSHGIRAVPGKLHVGALKHDRFPVSSVH